jgi:mannosyl-oligosaccharide alpha-1,2-mannosidase
MLTPRRLLRYVVAAVLLVLIVYYTGLWSAHERLQNGDFQYVPSWDDGEVGMDRLVKSGFDWGKLPHHFPVSSMIPLPTGKPTSQPKIQHDFVSESVITRARLDSRRLEVRKAFQKCWNNYKKYAWMRDELTPLTGHGKDTLGGWAATLIDSLDTLWIMGLKEDFKEAVEAVATIDWANTTSTSANIFETTIRHLGGLLAAYDLSHERVLLIKAVELGNMLYAGFDTPNRMPGFWVDFEKAKNGGLTADDNQASASPCSLSVEFTRLSQLTGNPKYYEAITRITLLLEKHQNLTRLPGMWPAFIDMRNQDFHQDNFFTVGAFADSLYEYLPKMHALLGGLDSVYEKIAKQSLATVKKHILFRPMLPDEADILFAGDVRVDQDGHPKMNAEGQHLSCFIGGMFALSGRLFEMEEYVNIGAKLTQGCIWAYNAFPTGIMPEQFNMLPCETLSGCEWDEERWKKDGSKSLPKGFKDARSLAYLLRPEAIESVFIMYRITGRREYQDAAWKMFQAIMKVTETEFGNAAINDVTVTGPTTKKDSMEVILCLPFQTCIWY